MYSSLHLQLQGFQISILIGFLLGAFYDVFRIYRTVFGPEKRAVFFQDLFYMVCAAFLTFFLAVGVNYGEVRFYILAGEAVGWCLYYLTVGMVTYQVFRFVSHILRKYLFAPLRRYFTKISGWFGGKIKILCKNMKIAVQNRKKRLKQRKDIVYNQFKRKRMARNKRVSSKRNGTVHKRAGSGRTGRR